jgi:hypothetical protein
MRLTKETILKIAGAFTIINMPNLARAATEIAKQTPRGGWQALGEMKDNAVGLVSSIVGTFRGTSQAIEGFAKSMAILTENIPLLVPYLKTRTDALFVFMMMFACLVLYTFHRNSIQVSLPLMTFRKNGNNMARLISSVPNSNKKNVFALSLIRDLPPVQKTKALEQYFAAQKMQGLAGLEQMAGSPGFMKNLSDIIGNMASSIRQKSSTTIVNVTSNNNTLSRTSSTATSIPRTVPISPRGNLNFSNANAANVLMNFRKHSIS